MPYAIDPEIAPWVALLAEVPITDLARAREIAHHLTSTGPLREPAIALAITEQTVPGPKGAPDVPVRIYRPRTGAPRFPAVVYLHGGGFVLGDLHMAHSEALRIAELGAIVVSVDYRLAPEHPYPAAIEDSYAALSWTAAQADVDSERVAVAGGSAGGGLAAGLALLARDRGGPALCFQMLSVPKVDDRLDTVSMRTFTDTPVWDSNKVALTWRYYLGELFGNPAAEVPIYAAPARAADLSGLPPAFISTCEFDPLRDEGLAYALRLVQAGVPTELHLYPGTFHGSKLVESAQVTQQMYLDDRRAFIRRLGIDPAAAEQITSEMGAHADR